MIIEQGKIVKRKPKSTVYFKMMIWTLLKWRNLYLKRYDLDSKQANHLLGKKNKLIYLPETSCPQDTFESVSKQKKIQWLNGSEP